MPLAWGPGRGGARPGWGFDSGRPGALHAGCRDSAGPCGAGRRRARARRQSQRNPASSPAGRDPASPRQMGMAVPAKAEEVTDAKVLHKLFCLVFEDSSRLTRRRRTDFTASRWESWDPNPGLSPLSHDFTSVMFSRKEPSGESGSQSSSVPVPCFVLPPSSRHQGLKGPCSVCKSPFEGGSTVTGSSSQLS